MYHESNFDHLPSQSNIYGITCIQGKDSQRNTVLAASAKGKIFACEFQNRSSDVQSVSKEVSFTYIPGKCCIISIDSFSCAARGLIIGVTFCNETGETFLNIYCNYGDDVLSGQEWNLDNVAQNCRSFALHFVPYQLLHYKVLCPVDRLQRTVFILLGGEKSFHVFAQGQNDIVFSEVATQDYFSELASTSSVPTYLEIKKINDTERITVIGCENGSILAYLVNADSNTTCASWNIQHDSPIVQIMLCDVCGKAPLTTDEQTTGLTRKYDVCIASAREDTVLYHDLLDNGFTSPLMLAQSSNYDCVTCCAFVMNGNTGSHEVLVGTYGQMLLAYGINPPKLKPCESIKPSWHRQLAHPLLSIKLLDMAGDGVDEMVVVTTKGVHVLQPNVPDMLKKCKAQLFDLLTINNESTTVEDPS